MLAVDKATFRRAALAHRAGLGPEKRARSDAARSARLLDAPLVAAAECLTVYVSVGAEPNTSALIRTLTARGQRVLLPRLRPDGGLDLVSDDGSRLPGRRGTLEPTGPAVRDRPDLWIVPALAVSRSGVRLGRGGGAYDRVLPGGVPVIALLHTGELVHELPAEPHDRPVTHAALPDALITLPDSS
jgi:5-formyltetrahydrofolate cyclo-ligase